MAALTIDELAATTGQTARNIRSYQTRGLLPAPELRGRVAFYGNDHIARLETIKQLQADGMSLKLIERFVLDRGQAADQLLELRHRVLMGFDAPAEQATATLEELVARFGDFGGAIIERAVEIGLLVPRDDGLIGIAHPALLDTAERAVAEGMSLASALEIADTVRRSCEASARAFVKVVIEEVWRPFEKAGQPAEQLSDVVAQIDRLRPLAGEIFSVMLAPTVAAEVDRAIGFELSEQARAE